MVTMNQEEGSILGMRRAVNMNLFSMNKTPCELTN